LHTASVFVMTLQLPDSHEAPAFVQVPPLRCGEQMAAVVHHDPGSQPSALR
jgi:hypothetical protein